MWRTVKNAYRGLVAAGAIVGIYHAIKAVWYLPLEDAWFQPAELLRWVLLLSLLNFLIDVLTIMLIGLRQWKQLHHLEQWERD